MIRIGDVAYVSMRLDETNTVITSEAEGRASSSSTTVYFLTAAGRFKSSC